MNYLCPVCGFTGLEDPPQDFNICPCCGTEFGHDDFGMSQAEVNAKRAELRWRWFEEGAVWWRTGTTAPTGWDPYRQLDEAGFIVQLPAALRAGTTRTRLQLVTEPFVEAAVA